MATERQIGVSLTSFVRSHYPDVIWFHVANEGQQNKVAEGVLPGAADYFLSEPMGIFCGLYLEIKTERGKLSDKQASFGKKAIEKGYHWEVAYGIEQCYDAVKRYMSL